MPPRWRTHLGSQGYCKPASPSSFDIVRRANELNVRLSPREIECLLAHCDEMGNRDGKLTHDEFMNLAKKERDDDAERQVLVGFIVKSDEHTVGQRVLQAIDYLSTALFGAVGVIIAGQTGMNVVGTTFVGCIACLGGGTLNDMMTGNTRQGIFWMRNPAFLGIALGTSVFTFYAWPMFEEAYAQRQMATLRQAAGVAPGEQIGSEAFVAALAKEPKEARVIFSAVDRHIEEELGRACLDDAERARLVFDWLLKAHPSPSRELETPALQLVARLCVLDSPNVYILETLGLGGLAVIGAQAGIVRGVHPLACIATGVTICFGGVLRDLLCHRPLAIGAQSYALATAAGASVYVGLRQLVIAGYPIPLPLRIALGACTAMAQRVYSYYSHGVHDQFLKPMANYRASTRLIPSGKSSEDLCDAAARGDCATVKRLVVERGLDPCKGDYDARTPLQ
ncbi:hypothetical protein AB1Y20_022636 [Prymnesium parvum]|uniref:Glycine transporter domain-containing protein n=1 Tax=Prymnesium parvum TaxID=97485 RepID=A0AB34JII5_PRYPA